MSIPAAPAFERVCVAVDAAANAPDALRAAATLAAAFDAELAGLFVEDLNLVRAAELSFTRELGLESGVSRPLAAEDIERSLRVQAEAMRQAVEKTAAGMRLRWSFATMRVSGAIPVLALARPSSIMVVAARGATAAMRHARRSATSGSLVAVLDDATADVVLAMRLAALLAVEHRATLLVLHERGARAGATAARASSERPDVQHLELAELTPAAVAAAVNRHAAGILVAASAAFVSLDEAGELLSLVACPVVVVAADAV